MDASRQVVGQRIMYLWERVHGVTKSQIRLSDFTFTFHFHALEKEMATHSSVLAWRTPGMGEPGGLPSMGSHRVRYDWSDLGAVAAAAVTAITIIVVEIMVMEISWALCQSCAWPWTRYVDSHCHHARKLLLFLPHRQEASVSQTLNKCSMSHRW